MKRTILNLILVALTISLIGCGAPVAAPMAPADSGSGDAMAADYAAGDAAGAEEAMAESEAAGDAATESEIGTASLGERKIIREATVRLETENVTDALNWATALSVRTGGYTTHSHSWMANEQQHSTFSFAVPVERFEEALEQTRSLGKVLGETVSSRDVTAQYVDIAARIENLEATTERVRSFLAEATTVKQTLEVNRELTKLEGNLNSLKGQRNVLARQTSFSTIHLELTPIPVPPTTAEVANTVTAWTPIQTFNDALAALLSVLQVGADLLIWLVVVGGPVIVGLALAWALLRRLLPLLRRREVEVEVEATS